MIWLRSPNVCQWFLGIFSYKPIGCRSKIFPRFPPDFTWYPSDLCREVRESQGKVCRKSQGKSGNSNRADWWQPCISNGSTVRALNNRHRHRNKHTDGTDFIPSTADAGGNKYSHPRKLMSKKENIEKSVFLCQTRGNITTLLIPITQYEYE